MKSPRDLSILQDKKKDILFRIFQENGNKDLKGEGMVMAKKEWIMTLGIVLLIFCTIAAVNM